MSVARPTAANALDHVVVLMFENRSFDNLLGRLYQPGEVESFEGVLGKDLSNPIPGWAEDAGKGFVPYGLASAMDTPNPDPGEELPHVNTQLFNVLDDGNRGLVTPEKTFNVPSAGAQPTMDGFVADYISMLEAELGRAPKFTEYSQIMVGYSPEQMPVLSGLARVRHVRPLVLRGAVVHVHQSVVLPCRHRVGLRRKHDAGRLVPRAQPR